MAEEQVATVSEEVEPAEVQETENVEETETTEEEPETSTEEDDSGSEDEETDEESEEEEADESEESAEEGESEGPKKLSAQERIQQLANAKRELENKVKELEDRFNQDREQREAEQVIDVQALNAHLGKLADEIEELRLDGKHLDASLKEAERDGLIAEYKKWEKETNERKSRLNSAKTEQTKRQSALREFDEACVFLAKENKIPDDTFNQMGSMFQELVEGDRVFAKMVIEEIENRGPVHAAKFVHDAIKERLNEKQSKAVEKKQHKEQAKKTTVQKTGSSRKAEALSDDLPADKWFELREKQLNQR